MQNLDNEILKLVDRVKRIQSVNKYPYLVEYLDNIKEEIKNKVFRLTVVGEFSSGKSTFLNALIGKDILPHAVSETTATITYIHNVKKGDPLENKAVIHFNKNEKKDETLDLISEKRKFQNYLSALNENGDDIVKLVKFVDVYVNFSTIDAPIVIVDTPGLNGIADGHRDVTITEISRSHASVCVFHLRGVGQSDLSFIRKLQEFQDTFFFVINQIDDLKAQEETAEERIESFRAEIENSVFEGKEKPKYIYGISGLLALASRDKNIKYLYAKDKEAGRELTDAEREELWTKSRFEILEKDLFDYLSSSDKDKQYYTSIFQQIETILNQVLETNQTIKSIYNADLNEIPEKKLLEDELALLKQMAQKNRNQLKINIGSDLDDFAKKLRESELKHCSDQIDVFRKKLDGITTVEQVKSFNSNNTLGNEATTFYTKEKINIENTIYNHCCSLYEEQVEEIKKQMSRLQFSKKELNLNLSVSLDVENYEFNTDRVARKLNEIQNLQVELTQKQSSLNSKKCDLDQQRQVLNRTQVQKASALDRVPSYKQWTEDVWVGTKKVKQSGGWGLFKRVVTFGHCGYDEEDIYETRTYDNQGEINRLKREIESDYGPKISEIKRVIDGIQDAIDVDESAAQALKSMLSRKQEELRLAERERDNLIESSKSSWIRVQKKKMEEQIARWFENGGVIYESLLEGIRNNITDSKETLCKEIHSFYDIKMNEYTLIVESTIKRLESTGENKHKAEQLKIVEGDLKEICNCKSTITNFKNKL